MKIAIYCRVSTSEQTTTNQRQSLEKYAITMGWEYMIFEEVESSRRSRPIKAKVLQSLRDGLFDGILVYKLDRYARSSTELILEIQELVNKGIRFYSLTENLDFSTASGKLHFAILSAFASFERDLIRERTIEGLNRAKSQGKKAGRPKGSKDKSKRRNEGYLLREAKKKVERLSNVPPNNRKKE